VIAKQVVAHHNEGDSRQQAASSVMPRPPRATKSATRVLTEYPDFAVVLSAWRDLPEAIRADIVAMVKAASV
jgi:hypothetical protein